MQVSVSTTGPLERRVTVRVPEDQISNEVQNRLRTISRTVRIDGFRPGKAPLRLVERRFASQVREEVVGEVLRKTFSEAVTKENLRPAGRPVIDPVNSDPGQGLFYTATFEVYPEVKLAPLGELRVEKPFCEISDADIDRMIETLRRQRRSWRSVERAAERGDRVNIDFRGTVDGEEFAGGSAEDFDIELGAGRFIASLEEGLIGRTVGEHVLEVQFPADYHRAGLGGKAARFEVKVNGVSVPVLPELDEEFFMAFGVNEGGAQAFRAEVRRNMERERDQAAHNLTKQRVLDALLAANTLRLPRALVEGEAQRLLEETLRNLTMQGVPRDRIEAMKPDHFNEQAQRRVALGLIMGDIIQSNGIKVDGARVRAAIERIATSYDEPAAVVKWYYEDANRLSEVEISVLEDQAIDWMLERVQVSEQPVAFDDLMNPRQTARQD